MARKLERPGMNLDRRQQTMTQQMQRETRTISKLGQGSAGENNKWQGGKTRPRKQNLNREQENRLQNETFTMTLIFHRVTRIHVHLSFLGPMKKSKCEKTKAEAFPSIIDSDRSAVGNHPALSSPTACSYSSPTDAHF